LKRSESYSGTRVTVMGLGLHGGGVSAARFLARQGAKVTVTDLRNEAELRPSLEALDGLDIRFVLGRHEEADFSRADIVVKNPAVRRTSRYLGLARRIETDVSLFLTRNRSELAVVTGTKGKSSTASALHHILSRAGAPSLLGGNITRSPLDFLEAADQEHTVVLELSSFQLGDLTLTPGGIHALTPQVSMITSIFRDHLDYYESMKEYVADKRLIYAAQGSDDWTIARDDEWGRSFLAETRARRAVVSDTRPAGSGAAGGRVEASTRDERFEASAFFEGPVGIARVADREEQVVPEELLVPGVHMRRNLLAAALACRLLGVPAATVRDAVAAYPGIDHRLELVTERDGVRFYNDSAATIPEATLEAVSAFDAPVHLIAGGTDKNIDFSPFAEIAGRVAGLYLLEGNAAETITAAVVRGGHTAPAGPFSSLEKAIGAAARVAHRGEIVILSPGCASFGMFQNEFDRGRQFRELVRALR
jgi:UDP-N-acetylmuramoylalanine--D-glutamate ligase